TVPDSHGQVGSRNASPKAPITTTSDVESLAVRAAAPCRASAGQRAMALALAVASTGSRGWAAGRITGPFAVSKAEAVFRAADEGDGEKITGSPAPAIREDVAPEAIKAPHPHCLAAAAAASASCAGQPRRPVVEVDRTVARPYHS